jgi:nitrate reductase NapAB chaperone NapD
MKGYQMAGILENILEVTLVFNLKDEQEPGRIVEEGE